MKIRDLITQDKATLSFEVFPPKKDTDFADVEAAALGIAAFKPDYMSVTYGAGGSTKGHTIQLAQEIQEKYDVPTIAHLTCVCASKEGIKTALADMLVQMNTKSGEIRFAKSSLLAIKIFEQEL